MPRKIPPAGESVLCPKCGTPNLLGAKFCKKDGYALQAGVAAPQVIPVAKESSAAAPPAKGPEPLPPSPTPAPQAVPIKQPAPVTARSVDIGRETSAAKVSTAASVDKSRKGVMIGALVGVVLLAGAGGGYAYWAGYLGNRQGDVQARINTELSSRGLSNVKVTIDREWGASLSGTVLQQADKEQALELIKSHTELKNVVADLVLVQTGAADLEKNLNKALANAGFSSITAQVDKEMVATLTGEAANPDQKMQALNVASGVTGLKDVRDDIQVAIAENVPPASPPEVAPPAAPPLPVAQAAPPPIDRAALERELHARLRTNGVGGVTGHVNPDMTIALSGTVRSEEDRVKALNLAGSLPGANGLRENIQVAAPQAARLARPQAPQPVQQAAAIDPGKLEGDINRALRNSGAGGVTAQVGDDLSVTLKGSAGSSTEKERAMQIARQFKGVRTVKDKIFVVE
ncbi:MAG: BON domain-containing protein [Sulfurimicrobium sp.]|nr:BON domain-containing protein [Sulfurimicrobium sp.]